MPSLSPLSATALLVLFLTACSPTATITLTPETLPPEGAQAEDEDGRWEVEAEIVRSDMNAVYVEQNGQEYAIAHDSIAKIDHPGDALHRAGVGTMIGSVPMAALGIWASISANSTIGTESKNALASGAAFLATWVVPPGMILTGVGLLFAASEQEDESREKARRPKWRELSQWQVVPVFNADGAGIGLRMEF